MKPAKILICVGRSRTVHKPFVLQSNTMHELHNQNVFTG